MFDVPGDERQRANDETVGLAREILVRLDKALRARRLYDGNHSLVARFEGELREHLRHYLGTFGALRLRVRPTSFELGDKVIDGTGIDELALGFFRRGVIALRLAESTSDQELDTLIDIINRAFFARQLSDEDLLTMLWRAHLPSLKYSAVLGYTEDDGSGEPEDGLLADADTVGDALEDDAVGAFDLASLSAEQREVLEAKVLLLKGKDENLPREVAKLRSETEAETDVALLERLLTLTKASISLRDRQRDVSSDELVTILGSLRRGFFAAGDMDALARFAATVHAIAAQSELSTEDRDAVQRFLDAGVDERQLEEFLKRIPGGAAKNAPALASILKSFARNDRELIARLADHDETGAGREALNQVLVDVVGQDSDYLITRFRSLEGERAIEALALLSRQDVGSARKAVAVRLPAVGDEFQIELLEAIFTIPGLYDERLRAALLRLAQKGGGLRVHVLESYAVHADPAITNEVLAWVGTEELDTWDPKSVEAAFKVLFRAHEVRALPIVEGILARKSLFRRRPLLELKLAVVAALAYSEAPEAHAILDKQLASKEAELRDAARASLDRQALDRARSRMSVLPGDLPS